MSARPFSMVRTTDQWLRCAHEETALDVERGVVELAWDVAAPSAAREAPAGLGGLAFDGCDLYHADPARGRLTRWRWSAASGASAAPEAAGIDVIAAAPTATGDFAPSPGSRRPLSRPGGLTIDSGRRLYVAETGAGRVLIYDLADRRLLRRVDLATFGARPLDVLAEEARGAWVLLDAAPWLLWLGARELPIASAVSAGLRAPTRLARWPGRGLVVLDRATARIIPMDHPADGFELEGAADLELDGRGLLVIARGAGDDLRVFRVRDGVRTEEPPLKARGYDGTGIVRTPDGRIGYHTADGFRHAVPARRRYRATGRVTTFRLDAGRYQRAWGRLFIEACVPPGTELRVRCATSDEPPDGPALARTAPHNLAAGSVLRPDLSPPMLPREIDRPPGEAAWTALHRRGASEQPWPAQPQGEGDGDAAFATYEAPVLAPPGRYLWISLALTGDTRRTPRVRGLRVEHDDHDWLAQLPRVYASDERAASFLTRYLAPFDGMLGELDARAATRAALLDPRSAPADLLPWLAGLIGLVLDERWPVERRRALIGEAAALFRARGTRPGLERFLQLVLDRPVQVLEHFRLRGMGGPIVGADEAPRAVVGVGLRVHASRDPATPGDTARRDAASVFARHAHRFTVLVAASLTTEQRQMVDLVLALHRPAHTIADVCSAGAGMRAGDGLRLGLSSVIGASGAFTDAQLGASGLGHGTLLGRPGVGDRLGTATVSHTRLA